MRPAKKGFFYILKIIHRSLKKFAQKIFVWQTKKRVFLIMKILFNSLNSFVQKFSASEKRVFLYSKNYSWDIEQFCPRNFCRTERKKGFFNYENSIQGIIQNCPKKICRFGNLLSDQGLPTALFQDLKKIAQEKNKNFLGKIL